MNAREKQERNESILAVAGQLEQIRDIARKELGADVDPDMVHLIFDNMHLNDEMDMELLEKDLRNAVSLAEQLYGADGKKIETIVGVYERCCAKPFDELD